MFYKEMKNSNATIVSNDGKNVVLYTWYDNEFGYTKQVIRLAKYITKVIPLDNVVS